MYSDWGIYDSKSFHFAYLVFPDLFWQIYDCVVCVRITSSQVLSFSCLPVHAYLVCP